MKRLRSIGVLIVLASLFGMHAVYACEWMGARSPVNCCCEYMAGEASEATLGCPHERMDRTAPCCTLTFESCAAVGTATLAAEQQPAAKLTPKPPALAANTVVPLLPTTVRLRPLAAGIDAPPHTSRLYLITRRLRI